LLRGEAGIGKTALLDHVARSTGDMTLLRATGIEAEVDLPFAGLFGLLQPIADMLPSLPEVQSSALAGALGLEIPRNADRLLVGAALFGLLTAAAEERPVACLIDDAQWLDRPSLDALLFTARRVADRRIAVLLAAREGEPVSNHLAGFEELPVLPLDNAAASALLTRHVPISAHRVQSRIIEESQGNPLALLELVGALTERQRAGREELPEMLPPAPQLRRLFEERIDQLPETARAALLIAAADDSGELGVVLRAASALGLSAEPLDAAERARLISTDRGRVTFRHPMIRSTVYEVATASARRRAHEALASSLGGEVHPDRYAWQLARSAVGRDEAIASALEASAQRSARRAAHSSAATALVRAAELTADEARSVTRFAAAADEAWAAGEPERALDSIRAALDLANDRAVSASLLRLRGVIEARTGNLRQAYDLLSGAARLSPSSSVTLELLLEAAETASFLGDVGAVVELGRHAASLSPLDERDRFIIALLEGQGLLFAGEHEPAQEVLAEAVRLADELGDPRALVWAAKAASIGGDMGAGLPYASRAVEVARRHGLFSLLPLALEQHSTELLTTSALEAAYEAAVEGHRLSEDIGQGRSWHLTNMATVEAIWGRHEQAREHALEALALARRGGSTFHACISLWTLGYSELSAGRGDLAADHLLNATATGLADFSPIAGFAAMPDAIEAAVVAGRRAEATDRLAILRTWVGRAPTDARRALLARSEALLDVRQPEDAFRESLALGAASAPFQRGRTELLFGEWLRRRRRKRDARVHLRTALELFEAIGAAPLAARAKGELRAAGEAADRGRPSANGLTSRERQIATLVAEGRTNREIAGQLYLSPRTVEYHLRKVFEKLRIASRAELVRNGLPSGRAGAGPDL
jgi:DNA-binding CsgD family transcriptional regulator